MTCLIWFCWYHSNYDCKVCKEESLVSWKKTCDRIIAGTEESAESDTENIDTDQLKESERNSNSDKGDDENNDEDDDKKNDASSIEEEYDDSSTDDEASSDDKVDTSPKWASI